MQEEDPFEHTAWVGCMVVVLVLITLFGLVGAIVVRWKYL